MNATVLAQSVQRTINKFGNSFTYYARRTSTANFNDEGEWDESYETTTQSGKWVEPNVLSSLSHSEIGDIELNESDAIIGSDVNVVKGGKIVSNGINWVIEKEEPIRIKDTLVAKSISVKNIL